MYKHLIIIIILFGLPAFTAFADEAVDKADFKRLYAEFNHLYASSEEIDPIIDIAEKLYQLVPTVYGENSRNGANIIYNLATLYDEKGGDNQYSSNEKKASALYKEYFKILDKLDTPKNEIYFEQYLQFILAEYNADPLETNVSYSNKILRIADDINLPNIEKANLEYLVGIMRANTKKPIAARDLFRRSKSRYISEPGPDDISVARLSFWLAKVYLALDKYREAEKGFQETLRIFKNNDILQDDLILSSHAFLVELYEETGKSEKATLHSRAVAVERPKGFDRFITPIYRKQADFPNKAARKGLRASVIMEFDVDENGFTKNIKIIKSTHSVFNKPSIKAVEGFRYAPSVKDGKIVETEGVKFEYKYLVN